jgi:hypothetical protein
MLTVGQLLLTLTVVGYALIPIKADFNNTHATNPSWTPHARFHLVWQVLSYVGVGLVALYLIWVDGLHPPERERLYLAAALSGAIYVGFFVTVSARSIFEGALHDDNGYGLLRLPIGAKSLRWDANVTVFSFFSVVGLTGVFATLAS